MIIDGKKIAERIKEDIRICVANSKAKSLVIFYAGDNPVIERYIAMKERFGAEIGILVKVKKFTTDVAQDFLISEIKKSCNEYSGAIVQLPLPPHINREAVLDAVSLHQDVDVLSEAAFLSFAKGETKRLPPVVFAVASMIREYEIDLSGKNIVVVGRGRLVGLPIAAWLAREGFAYKTIDKDTADKETILRNADVIISGAGEAHFLRPEIIKEGSILFDAGTSTSDGKLAGDIDPAAYAKAALVSPVPGGVGPLTVVGLFRNLFL